MDIAQNRVVFLQRQLRDGGFDLFFHLGPEVRIGGEGHVQDAVQRGALS